MDAYKAQALAFYLRDAHHHYEQGNYPIVLALCYIIEILDPVNADMTRLRSDSLERSVRKESPHDPA